MAADGDRANRIPWPPLLDALTLAAAILLDRIVPSGPWPSALARHAFGAALLLAGLTVALAGVARFRAVGTPVDPTGRAQALATGGIYGVTRNPMYLGTCIAFLGLGLLIPLPWLLPLLPLLALGLWLLAIRREEAYLQRRFGAAYSDYRAKVRRWL